MNRMQLKRLAERLVSNMARTQKRNEKARVSAIRRRMLQFEALGIDPDKYILCDQCSL